MSRTAGVGLIVAILAAGGIVLGLATHAGLFSSKGPGTPPALAKLLRQPVPAELIATLDKASRKGLGLTAIPEDATFHLKAVSGPRLKVGDKVGVLYIGAEFCPYCAGQRWGLLLTLLRFGQFTGLRYMLSSATDAYPNTATVTFRHAKYQSKDVAFQAVEIKDRDRQKLMTPDKWQEHIFTTYDAPPYVGHTGGVPFVYVDGSYTLYWTMVRARKIRGMNWQQIADSLANPHSKLFKNVMPRVNLMTAAICKLDGNKPSDVCNAPGVVAVSGELSKLQPAKVHAAKH